MIYFKHCLTSVKTQQENFHFLNKSPGCLLEFSNTILCTMIKIPILSSMAMKALDYAGEMQLSV